MADPELVPICRRCGLLGLHGQCAGDSKCTCWCVGPVTLKPPAAPSARVVKATKRAMETDATGETYPSKRRKRSKPSIHPTKRAAIYARDNMACRYCWAWLTPKTVTLDHVVAWTRGGTNSPANLVTCCRRCNQRKGDGTYENAGMVLRGIKPLT